MTQLFAQPYDISATGFYFETAAEYEAKTKKLRNAYGHPSFRRRFVKRSGGACQSEACIPNLNFRKNVQ